MFISFGLSISDLFHLQNRFIRRALVLLLLLLGVSFQAFGQEATIVGTVTDPSGSVIANAKITAKNAETGLSRTITTNEAGQYVLPDVHIGHYDIRAEAAGFKAGEQKNIVLTVGDRTRVDFQLQVGAAQETVTVEAAAVHVETDSSEQSTLISSQQISELATNGRTIYTYVALTPGAASLMPDSQMPVPVGGNSNLSFNGNRPGHNLYLLDGGENSDRGGAGSSSVMPSIDAIAETQTLTSNYSADYGLSSGGTITSVVKSGTQKLHAEAWEFFRNDALDARNYFTGISKLRYNIYGFNAGGPVTFGKLYNPNKNKTFFFYNMEWRKIISGSSINQQVPIPATYGGNFAGNLPANFKLADKVTQVPNSGLHLPCQNQLSPAQQQAWATAFGVASPSLVPWSQPATGKYTDCAVHNATGDTLADNPTFNPFPTSLIPSTLLNAYAQSLLTVSGSKYGGIFPAPNNGSKFTQPVPVPTNVREEIVRVDHNFTDKFSVFGHFVAEQINQNFATSMWSGDNTPAVGNTFGNPSYAAVVHTAYSISPTLINEVAFNYNGNRIHILPAGLFTSPGAYNRFFNVSGQNADNRIPSINLNGATGTNYTVNWMPWNNKADDYQIRDDVSWTRGAHQFKMGASWAIYKKIQDWFKNTEGNYQFNGSFTGNDFADYLLGYGQDYSEDAFKSAGHWDNVSWALYLQDNYRLNKRLTLNLGLRWDGIPHTYEESNLMANFYPNLYSNSAVAVLSPGGNTIAATSPGLGPSPTVPGSNFYVNGIGICGKNGVPRGCVNDSWNNIQPRIGFAYDLSGNGKTVIRGGYGLMAERIQGNDVYNNAGTVPLAASIDFKNVILAAPGTGISGPPAAGIPVNNVTGLDLSNYTPPRSTQFSLGVQHSIAQSVLSVAYVGTQNRHQNFYQEIALSPLADVPFFVANAPCTAVTSYCPVIGQKPVYNSDVPYLGYHSIRLSRDEANGDYNSIQTSFRGSFFGRDLQYQLMYTYSHTNDAGSNGSSAGDLGNVSDPYQGWKYDFGPANFDIRNIFNANFVYDLPFFKHADSRLTKTMLGGWEISGIVAAMSGAPINIGLNGNSASSIVGNASNRPDQTGAGKNPHTVGEWFDTSVYSTPACATGGSGADCFGTTKRNSVIGPGRHNWNLSLFKNFAFNESRGSMLQFRAEFFNIWNHTQFNSSAQNGGVSNNFGANDFGQIKAAYDPRIIQLALKLSF